MSKNYSKEIVTVLEPWFAKAPELPKNAKEFLVKAMPWIALIFGLLGVLGSVSGLGIFAATAPVAAAVGEARSYGNIFIASIIWLVSAVLLLASYPGLKARTYKGWNLLFLSELVSLLGAIVSVSSLISGIIGVIIGLYLLFQIKSFYK